MFDQIFGNYLVQAGKLSQEKLDAVIEYESSVRVKLGTIAVAEKLMTDKQAEEVNQLQAVMDKRFGDIAVEKGYLTEGQVEALLKKQGNAYLSFAQALENQQLMSIEQLEQYMLDFQRDNNLTGSDIEDLKSDDVDRILPLYLPTGTDKYMNLVGTALRTIMRCVDTEVYPEKAYLATSCDADNGALQQVEGEHSVICAMAGKGQALLQPASIFGQEEFTEVNMDALDAIGELLNCINGLYATSLSQGGVFMELDLGSEEMLIVPLHIKGATVNFVAAIDHSIEMKQEV